MCVRFDDQGGDNTPNYEAVTSGKLYALEANKVKEGNMLIHYDPDCYILMIKP